MRCYSLQFQSSTFIAVVKTFEDEFLDDITLL